MRNVIHDYTNHFGCRAAIRVAAAFAAALEAVWMRRRRIVAKVRVPFGRRAPRVPNQIGSAIWFGSLRFRYLSRSDVALCKTYSFRSESHDESHYDRSACRSRGTTPSRHRLEGEGHLVCWSSRADGTVIQ